MPGPPPPPTYQGDAETGTQPGDDGQTGTGEQQAPAKKQQQERDPADMDESLGNRLNGGAKVSRQLMISLVVLSYVIISAVMSFSSLTYSQNNYLDEFGDDLTGDAEDIQEDEANRYRIGLAAFIFLLCAVMGHMYYSTYYSDNNKENENGDDKESGGSDPMSVLCVCLNVSDGMIGIFRIVIIALYLLGIILLYTYFFMNLSYLFDEDYSPYNEDNFTDDDEFDGLLTLVWASSFILPLLFLVVMLQFALPQRLLYIFEWRMFLYSFILTLSLLVYVIYWSGKDYYESSIDDTNENIEDINETTFTFVSLFCVFTFLVSLAICGVSGMKLFQMGEISKAGGGGAGASDSSYPDVYKIWIILAVLLFSSMFGFSICVACAANSESYMYLWVAVLMILTDILF